MNVFVHISGVNLQRVGVTQHTGGISESSHYIPIISTDKIKIYDCDDSRIVRRSNLCDRFWHNSYLCFLHNVAGRVSTSNSAGDCSNGVYVADNLFNSFFILFV